MKVIVACEYSGRVRDAFLKLGHDAISCDLLPTDSEGPHLIMDNDLHLKDTLYTKKWDLLIAHPPCTFIANSGVRWLKIVNGKITNKDREESLRQAVIFFKMILNAPIKRICVENPVPHKYAGLPPYSQIIQPWHFGHGETKATCLWLKNLPKLVWSETNTLFDKKSTVSGREQRIHKLPPTADRWKLRSTTFTGIAEAMANQWGK